MIICLRAVSVAVHIIIPFEGLAESIPVRDVQKDPIGIHVLDGLEPVPVEFGGFRFRSGTGRFSRYHDNCVISVICRNVSSFDLTGTITFED